MKVKATQTGYINEIRVYQGTEFEVTEKQFSETWMEKLDKPKKKTSKPKAEEISKDQIEVDQDVI